jgi:hypothetical protein
VVARDESGPPAAHEAPASAGVSSCRSPRVARRGELDVAKNDANRATMVLTTERLARLAQVRGLESARATIPVALSEAAFLGGVHLLPTASA